MHRFKIDTNSLPWLDSCTCRAQSSNSRLASRKRQLRGRRSIESANPQGERTLRCGASLIEVVVAIGMIGGILSLTGVTIHRLLRVEQASTQSFVTDRSISRLAMQFRDDVHRAQSGALSQSPENQRSELSLVSALGERIRYVVTDRGIARLVQDRRKIIAREDYRLADCRVSITQGSDSEPRLRSIVIERPSAIATNQPTVTRPLRALKIQAVLNQQPTTLTLLPKQNSSESSTDQPQIEEQQ